MPTTKRIGIDHVKIAAEILRQGGTVAFPTETVYGLGADALNPEAIDKIFAAKGRPSDNPLIVHIASLEQLETIAQTVTPLAKALIERYWPGPLTVVLKKSPDIPASVTAGLDTVAVRMPQDPIAIELIRLTDRPIVAPSANRSGRPSATSWQAVVEDLDGLIDGVLCGPPTRIGLESTVVDTTGKWPIILRHGAITQEMIQACIGNVSSATSDLQRRSPGTRHRHYQPRAQVVLIKDFLTLDPVLPDPAEIPVGIIGCRDDSDRAEFQNRLQKRYPHAEIKICRSMDEYASSLFEFFRHCDSLKLPTIFCQQVDSSGLGRAIMDRLTRASQ